MIDTGIIGNYKIIFQTIYLKYLKRVKQTKSITRPNTKPDEQYNTEIKSNEIVSFEGANETEFVPYKTVLYVRK